MSAPATAGSDRRVLIPAVSLPKGGGALRGIQDQLSTDPATGGVSLSIPVPSSPGRGGLEPRLQLRYQHGAGNGPFGIGWSLSLPAITRKTDKGIPRYLDEEDSDSFVLTGVGELVAIRAADHRRGNFRVRVYQPRVELEFVRIERWIAADGASHWRSIDRANVTSVYGRSAMARISDPEAPTRIFSWLLEQRRDDRGNAVSYAYAAENGAGVDAGHVGERHRFGPTGYCATAQRHPRWIRYGNRAPLRADEPEPEAPEAWLFELAFDYGDRAAPPHDEPHADTAPEPEPVRPWPVRRDAFSSYRAGFELRVARLCRRVLMIHRIPELGPGPVLVRSLDLSYVEDPAVSYLASATEAGYQRRDGEPGYRRATLPSIEFEYQGVPERLHDEIAWIEAEAGDPLPYPSEVETAWVDLDGEALPGLLELRERGWVYRPNRGAGRLGPPRRLPSLPSPADIGGHSSLIDLGGDGQLDLVRLDRAPAGYFTRTPEGEWRRFAELPALPRIEWSDARLRLVDLDGNGRPDLLLTEDQELVWYRSRGERGFDRARLAPRGGGPGERAPQFSDDIDQAVLVADMSGDGLMDIVRVRSRELSYWPNRGHGHFGPRIRMAIEPGLATADDFDPARVRFADIDGSGTADLLYIDARGVTIHLNLAGNALAPARRLSIPSADLGELARTLEVVDLLGNGTACLLWSSAAAAQRDRPLAYVAPAGPAKPHLLRAVINNFGGELRFEYASSTRDQLEDRNAGRPWLTRLPIPVQVVRRIERLDHLAGTRQVTSFAYHHGFFDPIEREFAGFAHVEQWDAERFEGVPEAALVRPPVLRKTWLHTGAWLGRERLEQLLAREYYAVDRGAPATPDTRLPDGLHPRDQREAARALRGRILREELYAEDESPASARPYVVTAHGYELRVLQPAAAEGARAVVFVHARERLALDYERSVADPRVRQELTLAVDDYGNVTRAATLAYPRRAAARLAEASACGYELDEQARGWVTVAAASFINLVDDPDQRRLGIPVETLEAELRGYQLGEEVLDFPAAAGLLGAAAARPLLAPEAMLAVQLGDLRPPVLDPVIGRQPPPQLRLLAAARWRYYDADAGQLQAAAIGRVSRLGLEHERYTLALTADQLVLLAHPDADTALRAAGYLAHAEIPSELADPLLPEAIASGGWWAPAGHVVHDDLAGARASFFTAERFVDATGQPHRITHDPHFLLPIEVRQPKVAGAPFASVTRIDNDYRVLGPWRIVDATALESALRYDTLGLVERSWRGGPSTIAGEDPGGSEAAPDRLFRYDVHAPRRDGQPAWSHAATRIRRSRGGAAFDADGQPLRDGWRHVRVYGDGEGRELLRMSQAEPGPVPMLDADGRLLRDEQGEPQTRHEPRRWVGSGRTVFDNKGELVKRYEPFFWHALEYCDERELVEWGVAPITFRDPLGRIVRTQLPDGTLTTVELDAWTRTSADANDTVLDSLWYAERGRPDPAGPEPSEAEARAAWLAARLADTRAREHFDALGRAILAVVHNRSDEGDTLEQTRRELDALGRERVLIDARGLVEQRQSFDLRGRTLKLESPDAGREHQLVDVEGRPVWQRDARGCTRRWVHDALGRPTHVWVAGPDAPERLAERLVYGELLGADASAARLRGRLHRHYDDAGVLINAGFDLDGRAIARARRVALDASGALDWSALADPTLSPGVLTELAAPALEPPDEALREQLRFDALARVVLWAGPDGSVVRTRYNEAQLLEGVDLWAHGLAAGAPLDVALLADDPRWTALIVDVDYDAKGQRVRVVYQNGALTEHAYDRRSFALRRTTTARAGLVLRDLHYVYDAVGDPVELDDRAPQQLLFEAEVPAPRSRYRYDGRGQLVWAAGREAPGGQPGPSGPALAELPHPGDAPALRAYVERYRYDRVGNLELVSHELEGEGWTRRYRYELDEQGRPRSNRLVETSVVGDTPDGPDSESYAHDQSGNLSAMPHLPQMLWDEHGRLRELDYGDGRARYTYDGEGWRVRKIVSEGERRAERVYFGGWERERVFGRNDRLERETQTVHVHDGERRVALLEATIGKRGNPKVDPATGLRVQLVDQLESSRMELGVDGQLCSYEEYYPFGATAYRSGAAKRYRFMGKERDDESGLDAFGARYGAAWLGRWTSVDPAGFIDGASRYVFVGNGPIRWRDPDGRAKTGFTLKRVRVDGIDAHYYKHKQLENVGDPEPWLISKFGSDSNSSFPHKASDMKVLASKEDLTEVAMVVRGLLGEAGADVASYKPRIRVGSEQDAIKLIHAVFKKSGYPAPIGYTAKRHGSPWRLSPRGRSGVMTMGKYQAPSYEKHPAEQRRLDLSAIQKQGREPTAWETKNLSTHMGEKGLPQHDLPHFKLVVGRYEDNKFITTFDAHIFFGDPEP